MSDLGTMPLGPMVTEVLGLLALPTSALLDTKIKDAINRAYESVAKSGTWPSLDRTDVVGLKSPALSSETTLLGLAATSPLPWGCRNAHAVFLNTSEQIELKQVTIDELLRRHRIDETGTPSFYALVGETVQYKELAASDTFVLTGNAANDDIATARIWYREQTGHLGEVVSPAFTGTFSSGITSPTAAAAGYSIERITVSKNWVGPITITRTTGATEIAAIATPFTTAASNPMRRVETRPLMRVAPLPTADTACTVVWRRVPRRLLKNDDVPEIPVSAALIYGAAADLLRSMKRMSQAAQMEAKKLEALTTEKAGEQALGGFAAPMFGNFLDGTGVYP